MCIDIYVFFSVLLNNRDEVNDITFLREIYLGPSFCNNIFETYMQV